MNHKELSTHDLNDEHEFWESVVVDSYIRSCIRGLHEWVISLAYPDVAFTYVKPHYQVLMNGVGRRSKKVAEWYFHGGKGVPGRHIHFRLPYAESSETDILKSDLSRKSEQPFNKRPRKDHIFTFNAYVRNDVELAKRIIGQRLKERSVSRT